MKYLILIILFFSSYNFIFSQNKTWTLDECIKYAVENSPKVNKQTARNNIYNQNYTEAIGGLLPSLNASTGINLGFGRGLDAETNSYTNISTLSNNYGIHSSLTIFNGFSSINNLKVQKMNKLMGKEQLEEIKDMIAYETMESYFNILYVKEIYKLAQLQLEESQKNLDKIKRMEELGISSTPDVAELIAKEASDNYNLTRQENLLKISIIRLKEKMNFPMDENLEISDYQMIHPIQKTDEAVSDIYAKTLSFHPKVLTSEYSLKSCELSYNVSKGKRYPKLNLEGGFSTGFSRYMNGSEYQLFNEQLKNKQGYYVGFSLSIPIFNGLYYSSNTKNSKQSLIIAQNEYNESLNNIYSEITQAVADMNGQADEYLKAQKQVEAMKLAHNANIKKYEEGLLNMLELNTSSNRLLLAEIDEINSKYMFLLKYKLVMYYKGIGFINE